MQLKDPKPAAPCTDLKFGCHIAEPARVPCSLLVRVLPTSQASLSRTTDTPHADVQELESKSQRAEWGSTEPAFRRASSASKGNALSGRRLYDLNQTPSIPTTARYSAVDRNQFYV